MYLTNRTMTIETEVIDNDNDSNFECDCRTRCWSPDRVYVPKNVSNKKYKGALSESERIISEAVKKAEQMKRDIVSEGKEEIHRLRQELDRDTKERRNELQRSERRLEQKEENLDRKIESISRKEEELTQKHEQTQEKLNQLSVKEQELISNLEQIAQLRVNRQETSCWPK